MPATGAQMLNGLLGFNDGRYELGVAGSGLRVTWNLNKHVVANRLTYIHGRDYGEIFRAHNLPILSQNSTTTGPVTADNRPQFLAISRKFSSQNSRSRFFVDLSRPPRFVNRNDKIEALLIDPIAGKRALSFGTDHLVNTITNIAPELIKHNKGEFTSFVDKVRGTMVGDNTIVNLEDLEGSLAAAVIIACANQESNKVRIILGPSKYRLLAKGKQVPRPMVKESRVISIYAKATGASEPDVGRHFDEWSFLPINPTVIKSGRMRGRYLTQSDINNFVAWQPDVDDKSDIPAPVAGEVQFSVASGKLTTVRERGPDQHQIESIRTGVKHLLNLIEDVRASAHLGNWSPGAQRKLNRLHDGLTAIEQSDDISDREVTLTALDGEAFRHVYKASEDELSDSAKAEFAPLLVQMDLVFSQFESWKEFKKFGSSIGWGAGFTDEYRNALKDVAEGIVHFPEPTATPEVRSAMQEAVTKIESEEITEQVAASARVQNVLSSLFGYFKNLGSRAAGKAGEKVQEVVLQGTDAALHQATLVLKGKLVELASSNPALFGWVLQFLKDR